MKPKFDCAIEEFYLVARLGWGACLTEIVRFHDLKGFYDALYIDGKIAAIKAAEDLPDEQVRNAVYQLLGSALKAKTNDGLSKWQALKLYITTAFSENPDQKTMLDAAGAKFYGPASDYNWEKVKALMNNGSNFILANSAALLAGNNMPATFEADFNLLRDAIVTKIPDFLAARQDSKEGTQEKIKASNTCYDELLNMFADGDYLFKGDVAVHDKFVFEKVLAVVTPPGASGTRFRFIQLGDNTPIEGVEIVLQKAGGVPIHIVTDANGRVQQDLEPGTYKLLAKKVSFNDLDDILIVETGVIGNKVFVMQPV